MMKSLVLVLVLAHLHVGVAEILHEFLAVDYKFPNETMRKEYIQSGKFDPKACYISDIAVDSRKFYPTTIYVTVPKIKYTTGVPSGLNTIYFDKALNKSMLVPYPSWEDNEQGNCKALQFPVSAAFDPNTGYLWVVDVGRSGVLAKTPLNLCPAKLVAFDTWRGHKRVFEYIFPDDVVNGTTNFLNDLVLDYVNPDRPKGVKYVYITDPLRHSIVVVDVDRRNSWNVHDISMAPGSRDTDITIHGKDYKLNLGIDGIGLSSNFNFVYYTLIAGQNLYQVPTWRLRQRQYWYKSVRKVGRLVSNTDGIMCGRDGLYFGALEQDALYKWDKKADMDRFHTPESSVEMYRDDTQILLAQNWETMQWIDAVSIDQQKRIYFTSVRAHKFFNDQMDFTGRDGFNFRIFRLPGSDPSYLSLSDRDVDVLG